MPFSLLTLLLPLLCAQTPGHATEIGEPNSSREALELLSQVAAAQLGQAPANMGLVDTLDLEVNLRERGEHPQEVSFTLFYTTYGEEQLEIVLDDPERGTRVAKGFSQQDYWLREGKGEKQLLLGHEFEKDRQSIDEALDLCADLLLLVDLRHLLQRAQPTQLQTQADGTRILHGQLRRPDGQLWDYRLAIPKDSLLPQWLEVSRLPTPNPDPAKAMPNPGTKDAEVAEEAALYQRFRLLAYKGFDGRQAPQIIQIFDQPQATLPARILELHRFHWNAHPQKIKPSR